MNITAQMVKQLRDKTEAGMMDCKKALVETDGDMEKAITWLRERGIAKAGKKAGRVAAEGLCNVVTNGNKAVLYELNSETDFVAKNEKFTNLVDRIGQILVNSDANNTEEALKIVDNGQDLNTIILEASGVIGEKISLRRVTIVSKNDNELFGIYKHMGGTIVSCVVVDNGDEIIAKDMAMHIAASSPRFITKEDIPQADIDKEKEIILHQALNENKESAKPKPEQIIIDKIVPGRLEKSLKEICLLSQPFVKNPDITVSQYLGNASVKCFVRLKVGEGIEKEVVDFAAEVAAQAGLSK